MSPITACTDLAHNAEGMDEAINDLMFMLNYVLVKEPKKIVTNSNKNANTQKAARRRGGGRSQRESGRGQAGASR